MNDAAADLMNITISSGTTWSFIPALVQIPSGQGNSITLQLSSMAGVTVAFASPPLTWYDPSFPRTIIPQPSDFSVLVNPNNSASLTITDNNSDSSTTIYSFLINALYNGSIVQSPDPTIINTGTDGFIEIQFPVAKAA